MLFHHNNFGDIMKTKGILKIFFTVSFCAALFAASAYFYLTITIEKQNSAADTKQSGIPYSSLPEDSGVLFAMPDGRGVLIYLEFSQNSISAVFIDDCSDGDSVYYGYPADYRIEGDYTLLAGIIDNAGGIELGTDEDRLRYTGVQVEELLSYTSDIRSLSKEVIRGLFKSIYKNGFQSSDMSYIMENCISSTLTLPECLNWDEYLPNMASAVTVIG